jgi:hypothetical protein
MQGSQRDGLRGHSTRLLVACLAGLAPAFAQAAEAVVRGQVRDAASGAPIAGAAVEAGGLETATDATGRFELTLPPGSWSLRSTAAGYLPRTLDVIADEGVEAEIEVDLTPGARFRAEVDVTGDPPATGGHRVRPADVKNVAGAAEDVFRAVQSLPGVAPVNEFQGRIAVRGGGPDENLTVVDGVEVHNPYRLQGVVGAFHPETIERFDLQVGVPDARHGDRLSSVLVVETREGTTAERLAGAGSVSLTDLSLVLEGRLPGARPGSWLVAGRRTYYDLVAERFADGDLPSFADAFAKLAWRPSPGRQASLLVMTGREGSDFPFGNDAAGAEDRLRGSARHILAAAGFRTSVPRGTARTVVSFYRTADDTGLHLDVADPSRSAGGLLTSDELDLSMDRRVRVRDLALRQEVALALTPSHSVEAGLEAHRLTSRWSWSLPPGRRPEYLPNPSRMWAGDAVPADFDSLVAVTRLAGYAQGRIQTTAGWLLEPGLRVEHSGINARTVLLPQLAVGRRIRADLRAGAAVGLRAQSPGYEKQLQSDYFVRLSDPPLDLDDERAWQASAGLEQAVGGATLKVEAFLRRLDRLILGRLETEDERRARVARYDFPTAIRDSVPAEARITTFPANAGRGSAYGVEVAFRAAERPETRASGWASYTWAVAKREAYGRTLPFDYDARHTLAMAGTVRVGARLELSLAGRVASGFPRTPAAGVRVAAVEDASDRDRDGDRAELVPERDAQGRLVYAVDPGGAGTLNTARLPLYARLDARLAFRPARADGRWLVYVDVLNVLGLRNPVFVDATLEPAPDDGPPRIVETERGSVPRLPSIGVRFSF